MKIDSWHWMGDWGREMRKIYRRWQTIYLVSSLCHCDRARRRHNNKQAQSSASGFNNTNHSTTTMSDNFLPGINRRYLGSFAGLLHAVSSVAALLVGNYLFLHCFLLGNDILASSEVDNSSLLPTIFHVTTGASGEYIDFYMH